jgi:hypothetical protein
MNPDRLLENNAIAFAAVFPLEDHRGFECAVALAKLALAVAADGSSRIAVPQREIRLGPSYRAGAGSSLRYPTDAYPEKPGTEVIMLGRAWPPAGSQATTLDVSVRVETGARTLHKAVRVFGPRVFTQKLLAVAPGPAGVLSEPVAIEYELAEGGTDRDRPHHNRGRDETNPVGIGHALDPVTLLGREAYRIEPLGGSRPAGFGPVSRDWSPRRQLFGTIDEAYQRRRYPVPPVDFDLKYNVDGHPDLWSPEPLVGDEPIEILGATPEAAWRFRLPRYRPRFDVLLDGRWQARETKLDTILIDIDDPADRIVELSWRCAVRLPRKSERLEKIRITNAVDLPRDYYDELHGQRPRAHDHSHQEAS